MQQRVSTSVLDSAFYSINRFHKISLFENTCECELVKMTYEGGKHLLCKHVSKKDPITPEIRFT